MPIITPIIERIKNKVVIDENTCCWIYTGHIDRHGYGQISNKSKTTTCHRVMYEYVNGICEKPFMVGHLCDEKYPIDSIEYRKCCNPDHLIKCSNKENIDRSVLLGRYNLSSGTFKKGECSGENNKNSKLKDEDIIEIRRKHSSFKYGEFKKYANELGVAYITCQKYVVKNDDGIYKKRPELLP